MSTENAVPAGYHTVTPYLIVRGGAAALEFYKAAFGAVETARIPMKDGRIGHAEMKIGDSAVMLADEFPENKINGPQTLGGTSVSMMIYVADVDAAFARTLAAGATVLNPVADQFYGDRSGCITDPFGHVWSLHARVREVPLEEMQRHLAAME